MVLLSRLVGRVRSMMDLDGREEPLRRFKPRPPNRRKRQLVFDALESRLLLCTDPAIPDPHPTDPLKEAEHEAILALVPYCAVTNTAIGGLWSDPASWQSGHVPGADANVLIPAGVTEIVDAIINSARLRTIRDDGTLRFDPTKNTGLLVDTLIVTPGGVLEIGTAANPIAADKQAKIRFADRGTIDATWDPNLLSRGLISHGKVTIYGAPVTPYVTLAQAPTKGATTLLLSQVPTNWKVGDRIIVTGTNPNGMQDDQLAIQGISGTQVTVSPLKYDHSVPGPGYSVYVANMSRNAVLESENPAGDLQSYSNPQFHRGHVMFMHSPKVDVHYAGFYGLGRTDKRNPIDDPVLDANGQLVPGTGLNPRGRYAVHFHRTGIDGTVPPAMVEGSAVVDSPGLGYVNHSSNVIFRNNVSFDVVGSHFFTEVGDEIGSFEGNLAIHSEGSGDGLESRRNIQDFGHGGHGFWFQGGGVKVDNNIAVGQRDAAFIFFTVPLKEGGVTKQFLAANLVDPSIAGGSSTIDVGAVPIREFKGNVAFASKDGFESWFHLLNAAHSARSVVDDLKIWNSRSMGLQIPYTNQTTLRNVWALGNLAKPGGTGIGRNEVTRNIIYDNVRLEGFNVGIAVPVNGTNLVQDGYLNNLQNIQVTTANSRSRVVNINGNIQWGTLSPTALGKQKQYNIFLQANFMPKQRDIAKLFNPDVILLGTVEYNGKQLFYNEQGANYVPFPSATTPSYFPPELLDKTNQQLWNQYGLAIGGIVAPSNATTDPKINGLIGNPVSYLPDLTLTSKKYINKLPGYQLTYKLANGTAVVDPQLTDLREGWNLITRQIGGMPRTFFVYGDTIAPTFQLSKGLKLVINPADLKTGFTVTGQILDDSIGSANFKMTFTNLDTLPQLTDPVTGMKYVVLNFTIHDKAGNTTAVSLNLVIDPNATLQRLIKRKDLAARVMSDTLLALLGFSVDIVGGA